MPYPVFFTVEGSYKAFGGDGDDVAANDGIPNLTALVIFTPQIKRGDIIVDDGVGYVPTPAAAFIDTDGVLKVRSRPDLPIEVADTVGDLPETGETTKAYFVDETGQYYLWDGDEYVVTLGYVPLRLLADQQLSDVELTYRVEFTNVKFHGASGKIKGFTFKAPTTDTSVSLIDLYQAANNEDAMDMRWTRTDSGELVRVFMVKPGQHADYTLGWANRMVGDDAISAVSFELLEESDDLELFSPTTSGYHTQVWVRGTPDVGSRHAAVCEITTTQGRTLSQVFMLEAIYPAAASSPEAADHDFVTPSADRYWGLAAIPGEEIVP